ncbi:IclR family transcriptional regulator [Brevibacillus choshinensis]|uniref:IclR family transcriptional regulator n=1 Tax=Brevibacillus choshinensis TaxID=54911 RepID=UPI002E1AEE6C|nr:IclR family transcriptional regulator [Brevibacillus choshinensis]
MTNQKKSTIRFSSLENALRLLNVFSMNEPELGISEIAYRLGVANSTASRLVTTLISEGFIAKDQKTNLYRLGTSVLALGHFVQSKLPLFRLTQPVLESLVKQTNETAHIGILKDNDLIYINKIECSHPVRLLSHVGKRNPCHCTSSGQVLMAYQEPYKINEFLQKSFESFSKKTITDQETLRNLLDTVKKQGYSVSIEELHEGVTSIAAPIKDGKGNIIASVTIAGPIQRINNATIPTLIKMVIQAGHEISKRLQLFSDNKVLDRNPLWYKESRSSTSPGI